MPIYEYQCSACHKFVECLQKINEEAPETCEYCGKHKTLHKKVSNTSFQLKGGGWYKDLYSSASKSDSSSTVESKKSDSNDKKAA